MGGFRPSKPARVCVDLHSCARACRHAHSRRLVSGCSARASRETNIHDPGVVLMKHATVLLAAAAGVLHSIGLYAASDALVLTNMPLALFLACALATSAASSAVIQNQSRRIVRGQHGRIGSHIAAHGFLLAISLWLFCYGLKHCGPVRAILVEASQVALVAAMTLTLRSTSWRLQQRWRWGVALVLVALLLLLGTHGVHPHRGLRTADFADGADGERWWWWPTHVVGEIALLVASLLMTVHQRVARPLMQAIGGPRRLFTCTAAAAATICAPAAVWQLRVMTPAARNHLYAFGATWRCVLFAVLVLAGSYRAQVASATLSASQTAVANLALSFFAAVLLDWCGCGWSNFFVDLCRLASFPV